jgi:hypothetical protein
MISTRLGRAVLNAATVALAKRDGAPEVERILRHYHEDAAAVAAAILIALAGTKREPGLMAQNHRVSERLRALAGEIETSDGVAKNECANA